MPDISWPTFMRLLEVLWTDFNIVNMVLFWYWQLRRNLKWHNRFQIFYVQVLTTSKFSCPKGHGIWRIDQARGITKFSDLQLLEDLCPSWRQGDGPKLPAGATWKRKVENCLSMPWIYYHLHLQVYKNDEPKSEYNVDIRNSGSLHKQLTYSHSQWCLDYNHTNYTISGMTFYFLLQLLLLSSLSELSKLRSQLSFCQFICNLLSACTALSLVLIGVILSQSPWLRGLRDCLYFQKSWVFKNVLLSVCGCVCDIHSKDLECLTGGKF